ncbi:MAG: CoA-binding protein [Bacteroidia bacterium]
MKTHTLVIGASENPQRYSNMAIRRLRSKGIPVHAVGLKKGRVEDVEIETGHPLFSDVDTVTLYVGPQHQAEVEEYVRSLHPRRVIFNPGTESVSFQEDLRKDGVEVLEACTLVMLGTGQY